MRLLFMGTPDFAVPSLRALAASQHQIVAVVTNPDRPKGRGRRLASPPIKMAAEALGLQVVQPETLKGPQVAAQLRGFEADLFVVVAFSILPRTLLAVPKWGCINLHPSLLPAYRGAAPLVWAVINGETETGISTFLLNARMDAGDILLQERLAIDPDETAGELEARVRPLGAALLVKTVDGLAQGRLQGQSQGDAGASRAPKLSKEDGLIDWRRPAVVLRNLVRGSNPMPGAYTWWKGKPLKVHRVQVVEIPPGLRPGTVVEADPRLGMVVAGGEQGLRLTEVQPAGKGAMDGGAFVRGNPVEAGTVLGLGPE